MAVFVLSAVGVNEWSAATVDLDIEAEACERQQIADAAANERDPGWGVLDDPQGCKPTLTRGHVLELNLAPRCNMSSESATM